MKKFWEKIGTSETRHILAITYVLGVLGYIYLLIWVPVPEGNRDLVNVLGGTVITGSGIVLASVFDSARSSSDQNKSNNTT